MSSELVFVTGAAGFVGANVVDAALKAGYHVRGSVRRQAQIDELNAYFHALYPAEKAEFVIVEDITTPSSYEGKLDGVNYIEHVASPLPAEGGPDTDWKRVMFEPAINGTTAILEAALKVPSMKRIVVTSSIVALVEPGTSELVPEDQPLRSVPDINGRYENSMAAYSSSKILADQAKTKFIAEKKPHFSIVSMNPSFIFGVDLLQTKPDGIRGTNAALWGSIHSEYPMLSNAGVHVLDVAQAHVAALTAQISNDARFLVSAPAFHWYHDVAAFLKKNYPAVDAKIREDAESKWHDLNTNKAQKLLGIKFRPFEQFVSDMLDQQLSLIEKAKTS